MRSITPLRGALALIGFTSVVAQVVLMRELMVAFCGNEIALGVMLACWLLWTAAGSGLLGRWASGAPPRRVVAGLQAAVAVGFPLAIVAVRQSRAVFQTARGELLGVGPMFATALVALALFCPLSGWLFTAGSRMLAGETGEAPGAATVSVYLLEAVGAVLGGLAASLLLVRFLQPFEIAALIGALNLAAAAMLLRRPACLLAVAALVVAAAPLERLTLEHFWRGFGLLAVRNSVYGNLAVLETEGSRSLAENGLVVLTVPDPAAAEEAVHLPLAEHPAPRRVLLIGGGANGSLAEALKHPTVERLDWVELDPTIPELARRYFPGAIPQDPRLLVHAVDGRLFVKSGGESFDVIIVNLPEPQTAQLNRFYTAGFFREASRRLRQGGVLALAFPASENYLSPEAAAFLRCIVQTLRSVFPHVTALPGETVHLFGSAAPLETGADALLARLRERHVATQYISEYLLPFRLTPERVSALEQRIAPGAATPVNRDFAPVAYYFDLTLWSARFGGAYRDLMKRAGAVPFWVVAAAVVLLVAALALVLRPSPAALCTGATGFTAIGIEILLLVGFQALYGYVYQQLAILVAAFMAGMALGSRAALARPAAPPLAAIQLLVAAAPAAVYGLLGLGPLAATALALACGALGGFQFAAASRHYFARAGRSAGKLYALDLAGSCAGALVVSVYTIPVFGFLRTALLLALVNAIPAWTARRPAR